MLTRVVAAVLVLTLTGPSVVAAACELTCAMGSHHHGAPASSAASCHDHQGSTRGVDARPPTVCHESGDLPSAIVDVALSAVALPTVIPATFVIDVGLAEPADVRAIQHSPGVNSRPANRPLRV
jgi:hypothetical protein